MLSDCVDVVSFDVGKFNMAVCAARVWAERVEVREWEIVNVNGATMRETCSNVMDMLEARPWVWGDPAVHVVVEQQTQTNAPMRVLQHVVQTLVDQRRRLAGLTGALPVVLIPARSKYDMVGGAIKGGYAANKRNSVAWARACEGLTDEQLAMFEDHKKRDDLSDSLMQGVWYARRRVMAKAAAEAAKAEAARVREEAKRAKEEERRAKAEARAAAQEARRAAKAARQEDRKRKEEEGRP